LKELSLLPNDNDAVAIIGNLRIDSRFANYMVLSHTSRAGGGDFALAADENVGTLLNAAIGKSILFRLNNETKWSILSNGVLSGNTVLLQLGNIANATPSGLNGGLFHNTLSDKTRVYEEGMWKDVIQDIPSFETQAISHSVEGALNIDFNAGVFAVVTLTANITSLTFTATDGKGQVLLVQDIVGGRVVSFAGLKSIDGSIPDYSVNANAESLIGVTIANSSVYVAGEGNMQTIA